MKKTFAMAAAAATLLGAAGLAVAQPAYGPNAVTYYPYEVAPPPPPAVAVYPPTVYPEVVPYQDTHTDGGASRAYSYWGAQKSN